jgi:hypothetical protein
LALLIPTCPSRLASGFGSLLFRHVLGAGSAALSSPEPTQESGCLALLLFFGPAVILAWAGRHDKLEGLESQVLSPKHLSYTAHNPIHPVFAKRPDPLHEADSVYSDDLRNVDDTILWQVAVVLVEFYVTRIIGAVRSRGRNANHHCVYGARVEGVTLDDYSRVNVTRLRT